MAVPHSQHLGVWGRARLLLPPRPRGIWGAPENLPLPPPPPTSWPSEWLCARDPRVGPCPPVPRVGAQLCPAPARAGRQTALPAGRGHG